MRLFTAIEIPEPLRESLSAIQDPDALQARWTDPEQFHVTLRFIGNVEEAQAARYEKALADVNAGPVQCDPYGLDVLPSRRSPRVLMLGLERTDSLMALYDAVSDGLETEGWRPKTVPIGPTSPSADWTRPTQTPSTTTSVSTRTVRFQTSRSIALCSTRAP